MVSKAMKETGVPPDIGPIFVVAGQVILGPQDFGKPIMTSGIQPNQTVILTDKPPIQPKVVGSPYYIPPYAEGTLVHIAEARSIARTWVQAQKPTLELRAFTDKVNESETFIQVRGTFADQYMLSHEFDVRISRADGKTLEGSYVT